MSAVRGLRHARSVRRIERFNEELEISVQRARDELAVTLAREHELALAHSRLQDRLDIARDLHDGLGGSLVRMTALVEQSGAPLQNRQFLSMLNLLRNDLRQTMTGGASADMKPPATPREWIAPLRYTQLSTSWGIESAGMFPPPGSSRPPPWRARPDRGRTTNAVIRTAGRVAVRLAQPDPGRWNSWSKTTARASTWPPCEAGISVGMRSMSTHIASAAACGSIPRPAARA